MVLHASAVEGHRPGLRWKTWGADSAPHPERPISSPTKIDPKPYACVSLTRCAHGHSDSGTYLYIHVHPERPPPTCFQTLSGTYALYTDTPREHLPPAPSAHVHSHHILNTPSPKIHVHGYTLKHAHTITVTRVHTTHPNQHIYTCFFSHMCLYTHTHAFNHIHKTRFSMP